MFDLGSFNKKKMFTLFNVYSFQIITKKSVLASNLGSLYFEVGMGTDYFRIQGACNRYDIVLHKPFLLYYSRGYGR